MSFIGISIFSACFLVICGIQIVYYATFLISFYKIPSNTKAKTPHLPISVIICAKNEAENLKAHLPKILEQHYPKFEVILVNDSSTDNTLAVMQHFKKHHGNISVISTTASNKKQALSKGINASKYEHILLTDADCKPLSNHWINEMSAHFSTTKTVILGYGGYKKAQNTITNKLIRFETVFTALQYFSLAKLGFPYMGVGRNLAYKKEEFKNSNGFKNHSHILSGDDDLFINEIATKNNVALCLSSNSFTISKPKPSFKTWFYQKRRHITTANHYKQSHKYILGGFYLSQVLFFTGICIIFNYGLQKINIVFAAAIAIRYAFQISTLVNACIKLKEKDLIIYLPFLEPFLVIFQLAIFTANLVTKPLHWK